jgi:phage tail-like protein
MTEPITRDVYATYRFWVELKGITEAAFAECTGLQAETEVFEWEEGGLNEYRHRLPGRTKFPNLTLKRGIAKSDLWEWYHGVLTGTKIQRHDFSIILVGYAGMNEARWNIFGALPIKWIGPTFKSGANEAAVETIELVHNGFERAK